MFFARRVVFITMLLPVIAAALLAGGESLWARPAPEKDSAPVNASKTSTATPTAEERMGALEETIRLLEARIRELEGQSAKPASVSAGATLPVSDGDAPKAAETAADSPKPEPAPPVGNRASFFDKVEFSGFVDGYYGYNFNRPASRKNGLRNFDFNHNQFNLNLIELALERKADPLGFRVDLNFGDTAKFVHSAEPGGSDVYQYLQQAYVTYKAPVGKGLSVDFGKFVTAMGAEVIESHANYNYSRSLLFAWAIPYYHFGTRITYPVSDRLTMGVHVVNGWNNVVDNNTGKSVGFMVSVTPHRRVTLTQNYMVGAEQANNNRDKRQMFDTVLTVSAGEKATFLLNYDYGMDRLLGDRVRWQGFAGAARFQLTPFFAIAPRLEWFDDPLGFSTGMAQTVKDATLTTEFKVRNGLLMRAEYRRDWSNRPFFEKRENQFSRSQTTATLGLIYIMGQEP